jgi:hypothetical protein
MLDHHYEDLDVLVFSSHKTTTQTLVATLRAAGYKSFHVHHLVDHRVVLGDPLYDVSVERFREVLREKNQLKIVSVLRDPFPRSMSSFFQTYHDDKIREGEPSVIMSTPLEELLERYLVHMREGTLPTFRESLFELSEILEDTDLLSRLVPHKNKDDFEYFTYSSPRYPHVELIVLYFDSVTRLSSSDPILNALGLEVDIDRLSNNTIVPLNISDKKGYASLYCEFREALVPREHEIREILKTVWYNNDQVLLDFFRNS